MFQNYERKGKGLTSACEESQDTSAMVDPSTLGTYTRHYDAEQTVPQVWVTLFIPHLILPMTYETNLWLEGCVVGRTVISKCCILNEFPGSNKKTIKRMPWV
jgi:hypothetical protein